MPSSVNTKALAQRLLISPRAARHLARTYFQFVFGGVTISERGYLLSPEQADDLVRSYKLAATYRLSFEQLLSLRQMHRMSLLAYLGQTEVPSVTDPAIGVERQVSATLERLSGLPETLSSLREMLMLFDVSTARRDFEMPENIKNA